MLKKFSNSFKRKKQVLSCGIWVNSTLQLSRLERPFEFMDNTPTCFHLRRIPAKHSDIVRMEIDAMLAVRIMKPAISAWVFPIVIAKNKDGFPMLCVDCRALKKNKSWPVYIAHDRRSDRWHDRLEIISKLDLFAGYWQIGIVESV